MITVIARLHNSLLKARWILRTHALYHVLYVVIVLEYFIRLILVLRCSRLYRYHRKKGYHRSVRAYKVYGVSLTTLYVLLVQAHQYCKFLTQDYIL